MPEAGMIFVLLLVGMSTVGWLANNWIRAKHGYALENEWKGQTPKGNPDDQRKIELLTNENERQAGQITRLEARLAVLERIVTDPAERTARDIDALR
jgi:hypothetical protein